MCCKKLFIVFSWVIFGFYVSIDLLANPLQEGASVGAKSAYAFASRFYLMKGEWDLVIDYANYVLGSDPSALLRKWNDNLSRYNDDPQEDFSSFSTNEYTNASAPSNLLLTATESRIKRNLPLERYGFTLNLRKQINNQGIDFCNNKQLGLMNDVQAGTFKLSDNPRMETYM